MAQGLHQHGVGRDGEDGEPPEPRQLRVLRLLVTILMVTMIVGIAVVAGALVYRIASESSPPAMTEITIESGLSVIQIDHTQPDRLVLVLRDTEGNETVRVYSAVHGVVPRYDGPVEAQ